ncbi:MAG: MOSC domain-containing protein [Candidatus Omnitrophota bacterium]|jgi:MOSC domain-containing protein YiiM
MNGNWSSGKIHTISVSSRRGIKKVNVPAATLIAGVGIDGDAHAGPGPRQVSLLSWEAIQAFNTRGVSCAPGDFAENICATGLDFSAIKPGTRILVGEDAELQVSRIGKECHAPCRIAQEAGDCIMPKEGVFAVVVRGGIIRVGDSVGVLPANQNAENVHV